MTARVDYSRQSTRAASERNHYFPTDTEVVTKAAGAIDRFLRSSLTLLQAPDQG